MFEHNAVVRFISLLATGPKPLNELLSEVALRDLELDPRDIGFQFNNLRIDFWFQARLPLFDQILVVSDGNCIGP